VTGIIEGGVTMIEFKTGNILVEDAEALVNTVNCVGIMGRGIALQFKNAFPENFLEYELACHHELVQPGQMFIHETRQLSNPRYIINFPTKRHWRGKSRIEDIQTGLTSLVEDVNTRGIRSIAIPPLGSGLGGLDWSEVRPLIVSAFAKSPDVKVIIFEPNASLDVRATSSSKDVPIMTPGRAALVGLMQRYLAALMDPFVTLLEIHKLMYFTQESGEKLRLQYTKAPFGPYAENLRHVLRQIEGHLISGYADGGDAPTKQLELVPKAAVDAQAFLKDRPETQAHLDRVFDLVEGFETAMGLELLSTVHWVATREQAKSVEDVVAKTYEWGDRKKQFSERQIAMAYNVLREKGWLPVSH
jgi:O-acetyl-ADP-ribose deacetylase (regulator of RNase III)